VALKILWQLEALAQQPAPSVENAAGRLGELATLLRYAPLAQLKAVRRHPVLAALLPVLAMAAPGADPAHLCSLLQSCAHLQLKLPREDLQAYATLLAAAAPVARPSHIVRSAWALSRLGFCSPVLLAAIKQQAMAGGWLPRVGGSGLVSLMWVCNRASYNSSSLLDAIMEALYGAEVAAARGGDRSTGRSSEEQRGQGAAAEDEEGVSARQLSIAFYSCAALLHKPSQVRQQG
jgi:hypothetical protein